MENNDKLVGTASVELDPKRNPVRAAFEQWYAADAFDYAKNPIGSRDCGLQWRAWKAAHAAEQADGVQTLGIPSKLYDAINALLAKIGSDGEVSSRDSTIARVMDALHDIDGGRAAQPQPSVADGFVLVPREPTPRMRSEGESAASVGIGRPSDDEAILRVWKAMLAAAPLPPETA